MNEIYGNTWNFYILFLFILQIFQIFIKFNTGYLIEGQLVFDKKMIF